MHELCESHEANTGSPVLVSGSRRVPPRSIFGKVARAFAAALLLSGVVSAGTPLPACIEVSSEARYRGVGYDHIVRIDNHCDTTAVCDVSTNVNPEPIHVTVPSKQAAEVLTFRGSPAREFTASTQCGLVL